MSTYGTEMQYLELNSYAVDTESYAWWVFHLQSRKPVQLPAMRADTYPPAFFGIAFILTIVVFPEMIFFV